VVVLESQAGWIGYFLDRADATFTGTMLGATVRLKEKPSYYFKRQCFISADPDERTIAALMPHVGEDKFFWASDYPHPDHPGSYLEELRDPQDPADARQGRRQLRPRRLRGRSADEPGVGEQPARESRRRDSRPRRGPGDAGPRGQGRGRAGAVVEAGRRGVPAVRGIP